MDIIVVQLVLLGAIIVGIGFAIGAAETLAKEAKKCNDAIAEWKDLQFTVDKGIKQNQLLLREAQEKLAAAKRYMGIKDED